MLHRYLLIASKIAIVNILLISTLNAKDVPIMKTVSVNIPLGEYSILDFPFIISEIQATSFTYPTTRKIVKKVIPSTQSIESNNEDKKITLSKKTNSKTKIIDTNKVKKTVLGLEQGKNVLTFKPTHIGYTEMIIWGYKNFPIMLKINVTSPEEADKYLRFVELVVNKKDVVKFESSSHEKVIENITQHLYDESYNTKPIGYESIVRKESYLQDVLNHRKEKIATIKLSLIREIIGRNYRGQVWNINLEDFSEPYFFGLLEKKIQVPESVEVTLYEELFNENGIYSISLESYGITRDHGTRVMIVRSRR